jgi:chromosome segregation ATPase
VRELEAQVASLLAQLRDRRVGGVLSAEAEAELRLRIEGELTARFRSQTDELSKELERHRRAGKKSELQLEHLKRAVDDANLNLRDWQDRAAAAERAKLDLEAQLARINESSERKVEEERLRRVKAEERGGGVDAALRQLQERLAVEKAARETEALKRSEAESARREADSSVEELRSEAARLLERQRGAEVALRERDVLLVRAESDKTQLLAEVARLKDTLSHRQVVVLKRK